MNGQQGLTAYYLSRVLTQSSWQRIADIAPATDPNKKEVLPVACPRLKYAEDFLLGVAYAGFDCGRNADRIDAQDLSRNRYEVMGSTDTLNKLIALLNKNGAHITLKDKRVADAMEKDQPMDALTLYIDITPPLAHKLLVVKKYLDKQETTLFVGIQKEEKARVSTFIIDALKLLKENDSTNVDEVKEVLTHLLQASIKGIIQDRGLLSGPSRKVTIGEHVTKQFKQLSPDCVKALQAQAAMFVDQWRQAEAGQREAIELQCEQAICRIAEEEVRIKLIERVHKNRLE